MKYRNVVKVTFFIYKKEDISDAEFARYWAEEHAPKAVQLMHKHGVLNYTPVSS
jgi:hypothetical protein